MTAPMEATPVKRRIALVVDDEKVIATTLAVILNNAGFDAHPPTLNITSLAIESF
jgi:hypothetical protein